VVGLSNVLGQQAVFNETHTFSARVVNNLAVGYTRRGNTIVGAYAEYHGFVGAGYSGDSYERGVQ
jgi:hypothetical protein